VELGEVRRAQGWAVWGGALLLAWLLPGALWKQAPPPPFPWGQVLPTAAALAALLAGTLGLVAWRGRAWSVSGWLGPWEALPDLLWGSLVLALWPASAGPPGHLAWVAAFLAAALPGEVRWLSQALPKEAPFPAAWGVAAVRRARREALRTLVPGWIGARLPLWLTATLVLERILGVRALGSDWMDRIALRDRAGLAVWVALLALLWAVSPRDPRRAR
jgi:hypothetical protein